ncbi:unnamed protein product, partial [Discosporangium mesarthrocarpum]
RLLLWSLQDTPLPDGWSSPHPVEVASLTMPTLASSSAPGAPLAAVGLGAVSSVGYYHSDGRGAPSEIQAVMCSSDGHITVVTARVQRDNVRAKFVFRNVRAVALPLIRGPPASRAVIGGSVAPPDGSMGGGEGGKRGPGADGGVGVGGGVVPHPNLPLIAEVSPQGNGRRILVHSWVNGGSHLQCIPCRPRGPWDGYQGHAVGSGPEARPGTGAWAGTGAGAGAIKGKAKAEAERGQGDGRGAAGGRKDRVARLFSDLEQKVKSGGELSFVPYALPALDLDDAATLTLPTTRLSGGPPGQGKDKPQSATLGLVLAPGPREDMGQRRVTHAMWVADWLGVEGLAPMLAVVEEGGSVAGDAEPVGSEGIGRGQGPREALAAVVKTTLTSTLRLFELDDGQQQQQQQQPVALRGRAARPGAGSGARAGVRAAGAKAGAGVRTGTQAWEKMVRLPLDAKYGLGLTLEFEEGKVVVASFVRHPDTGDMLPAEASGRVNPGDRLVEIDGVSVEGVGIDKATSLIREARRNTLEGCALTISLTLREPEEDVPVAVASGTASSGHFLLHRELTRSKSPRPRAGWYAHGSVKRLGSTGGGGSRRGHRLSGAVTGAGGGGSSRQGTDASRRSLQWVSVGMAALPRFRSCVLLPWLDLGAGADGVARAGGGTGLGQCPPLRWDDAAWAEMGVYAPGDGRRSRRGVLLGFQPLDPEACEGSGHVVATLLELRAGAGGGLAVEELCRAPLAAGHEPLTFNREKLPPGAPSSAYGVALAACRDGWVRQWCLLRGGGGGAEQGKGSWLLKSLDLCQPFHHHREASGIEGTGMGVAAGAGAGGGAGERGLVSLPSVHLIAAASPSLLAVVGWCHRGQAGGAETGRGAPKQGPGGVEQGPMAVEKDPILEVWACPSAYPKGHFRRECELPLGSLGDGEVAQGLCWAGPEAGDERGAAVSGHCLCVSVGGFVTVFAREQMRGGEGASGEASLRAIRRYGSKGVRGGGEQQGGERVEWVWHPILRVTSPSSLLSCHTAGLREFCQ